MRKISFLLITIILLATSCSSENATTVANSDLSVSETVSTNAIMSLICGSQTNCLSKICASTEKCPLTIALSNQVIFDFVKTFSKCEGCNTQAFSPEKGIGKCVEYKIANELQVWTVTFWMSENCKFRYSDPPQASISVKIDKATLTTESTSPGIAYIKNPFYCSVDSDCNGISGSGVPLIGCRNFLYAPLNWSGYYAPSSDMCVCEVNQCKQK